MTLSESSRKLLESPAVEGTVLHPYKDSGGYLTIGVGHLISAKEQARGTIYIAGKAVPWKNGLTPEQCDALCSQDVAWAEQDVTTHVTVSLTQHQFDALVIFVFNVGAGNFEHSQLLRLLNAGQYTAVPTQLARWTYVKGKKTAGLVHRRAIEAQLWGTP